MTAHAERATMIPSTLDTRTRVIGIANNLATKIGTTSRGLYRSTIAKEQLATLLPSTEYTLLSPIENFFPSSAKHWENIATKRALIEAGDKSHEAIKPVIAVGGGAMAGIISAVMLERLQTEGLLDMFDLEGQSVGAINAAVIRSNKNIDGVSVYTNVFANRKFIKRGVGPGRLNLDVLVDFLKSDQGIAPEVIRESPRKLLVAETDGYARTELIDMRDLKDKDEMIDVLIASCSAPFWYNKGHNIKNRRYIDGDINGPPFQQLVDRGYNTILYLSNCALEEIIDETPPSKTERAAVWWSMSGFPEPLREATLYRRVKRKKTLNSLNTFDAAITCIAPEKGMKNMLTIDKEELQQGAYEGIKALTKTLDHYLPHATAQVA